MLTKDDLPTVGVSRLRAQGVITPQTRRVDIAFKAEGGTLRYTVGVAHLNFPNGGGWSFFICPQCGRRARTLRLLEEKPVCRQCDGLMYRCQATNNAPWAARERIARLEAMLAGKCHNRARLTTSLRRAQLVLKRQQLCAANAKLAKD